MDSVAAHRSVVGLLLAAGLSTRMGRPKPLLPWDGGTLVEAQVGAMRAAGVGDLVVVSGHAADAVHAVLAGCNVRMVYNPVYATGRASSIRAGAAAIAEGCEAIVVLSVDQPRPASLIRAVIEGRRMADALIAVPRFGERRGHPVVFAGSLLLELRAVTEETEGLRAVRRRHADETVEIAVDDPRALLDINTPEAYAQARVAFGLGPLSGGWGT